jgi:coniferyl-aldehyde dehydrogenase
MKNDFPLDAGLDALLCTQRNAWLRAPYPAWCERAAHLRSLRRLLFDNQACIVKAIDADFGHRPQQETELSEFWIAKEEIDEALKHGKHWMKTSRRPMNKWMFPAKARLMPQPLGVIGILAPWNYPLLLSVTPLIGALAAGNRVMIKMSELTPRFSSLFETLIGQYFARDHVAVVNGGADVGATFSGLPFDHLVFTGSTQVGSQVMRAAADNLTPVTLELGGKSPSIIGRGARFDAAVDSIMTGKLLNAGQTCIAPDYVLVPRGSEQAFVKRARAVVEKRYPHFATNPDFTSIISDRHFGRLQRLVDEARETGAQVFPLTVPAPTAAPRRFAPIILTDVPEHAAIMQEEIFGPLLPLVPYDDLTDAIAYINARPRPLALYLFEHSPAAVNQVMRETVSGGVSLNETLMHIACGSLPFGGVGASGMGAYHGREGFAAFSQMKPVFSQSRLNARGLLAPPYGRSFAALIKVMLRY